MGKIKKQTQILSKFDDTRIRNQISFEIREKIWSKVSNQIQITVGIEIWEYIIYKETKIDAIF